jgi:hypothetical protein
LKTTIQLKSEKKINFLFDMLYRIVYDYNMFNLTNRRKKMLDATINLKDHYGRPTEFALTIAMEGIQSEVLRFWISRVDRLLNLNGQSFSCRIVLY